MPNLFIRCITIVFLAVFALVMIAEAATSLQLISETTGKWYVLIGSLLATARVLYQVNRNWEN